jgi:GAF domain-containing protein
MSKTVAKRSRKETEVERLSQVATVAAIALGQAVAEAKDLQQVNLQVNTLRVNTWHQMSAEREALIARIHHIDCLIAALGMNGPAQNQK